MSQEDTENKGKVGRPTIYTPELRAELCRRLAEGRTLRSVCRDEDMPHRRTVEEWLMIDYDKEKDKPPVIDDFLSHYTRARAVQAENIHDEIVEIADDATNDFMELVKKQKNGAEKKTIIFDKEHVLRSKLRVDARLSWLSNTAPRKYGKQVVDKTVQQLGKDGKPVDPNEGLSKAITKALEDVRSGKVRDDG